MSLHHKTDRTWHGRQSSNKNTVLNRFAYVVDGDGRFGAEGERAGDGQMVMFAQDGDEASRRLCGERCFPATRTSGRTQMRLSQRESLILGQGVIRITVQPALSRLGRSNYRMTTSSGVLSGMAVG